MSRPQYIKHRPLFTSAVPKDVKKAKIEWKVLPIMWMAFKRLCFLVGFSMIISALIGVYSASLIQEKSVPSLPKEMVLYLEFKDGFQETPKPASFSEPFAGNALTFRDTIQALDQAAVDPRVKGMFARMDNGSFALTQIQEIRAAIKRFRDTGKFAYIYSSSYGEAAGGLGRYYLASAFEEIWMQPLGIVTVAGVKAEVPFLRGVLDKIGITPDFFQREEYKTAYESLTNKTFSKENKEMMTNIIDNIRSAIMNDVPAERGIDPQDFEALVDKGLFTAKDALDAGLITHMDYADVLVDRIETDLTGSNEPEKDVFIGLRSYASGLAREKHHNLMQTPFAMNNPEVALIYAVGAIMDGEDDGSPGFGSGIANSKVISGAIMDAADDDNIKTIILRVDSPGGSPIASERILRSIERAKAKEKTIIVSMGAMAASGGYWISAYADRIFALPSTLTGSIGVIGGKFAMGELIAKTGANFESIGWGENAGIWSFTQPFTPSESERINLMLDAVYDGFLERVSKGREIPVEDVRKIAGGRVWTGDKALEVGLVDEIGGYHEVLQYVAELEGVESQSNLDIIVLPRPKSRIQKLFELLAESGAVYEGLRFQTKIMSKLGIYWDNFSVMMSGSPAQAYNPVRIE